MYISALFVIFITYVVVSTVLLDSFYCCRFVVCVDFNIWCLGIPVVFVNILKLFVVCSWFYASSCTDVSAMGHNTAIAITVAHSNVWWSERRQQLCMDS